MYGADAHQLEDLARRMTLAADQFDRIRVSTRSSLHSIRWSGADADQVRSQWEARNGPILAHAAHGLRQAAERLTQNAHDQVAASAAQAGSSGGGFPPGAGGSGGNGLLPGIFPSRQSLDDLAEFLFKTGGLLADLVNAKEMTNLFIAILGGTKELEALQKGPFPYLGMALYGAEAAYWTWSAGIDDARAWEPGMRAALTVGAMAATAAAGAGVVAGAAAAGAGFFIGDRINDAFEITTGQSLSDHMADAAIGDEIDAIDRRSAANEIDKSMSRAELSRHAEEANRIAQDAHKLTERTKTPWGCVSLMLGF